MKKFLSLLASLLLLLLPLLTMAAEPRKILAAKSIDSNKNLPNSLEPDIGPLSGEYYPIEDLNSEHIQELGEFAVHEHNKKTGDHLKYLKVYAGEFQRVDGYNYKLSISAIGGRRALRLNFEALVHDDLMGKWTLESFVYKPDEPFFF